MTVILKLKDSKNYKKKAEKIQTRSRAHESIYPQHMDSIFKA